MLPLLRINDLSIDFVSESGITSALKNISLSVNRSEILAIVGESGSGKSVTALSILQLLASTAKFTSGEIIFSEDGKNEIDLIRLQIKNYKKFVAIRSQ
jgi:peptide/nickel transport system ATP-binding protein